MKRWMGVALAVTLVGSFVNAETLTILDLKKNEMSKERANALLFYSEGKESRGLKPQGGSWTLEVATSIGVWTIVAVNPTRLGVVNAKKLVPVEYSVIQCFEYAPDGELGLAKSPTTKQTFLGKFQNEAGEIFYSTADEDGTSRPRNRLSLAQLNSLVAFLATPRGKAAQFPLGRQEKAYNYRYEVKFDGQGADSAPVPESLLAEPDRLTSLPKEPTKAGYVFDGWFTAAEGQGTPVEINRRLKADTIAYANWLKPFTVSFDGNGEPLVPAPAPKIATAKKGMGELPPEPQREGYLFGGWYHDREGTAAFNPAAPMSADTVVYAKWIAAFDVVFDGNGADESWQNKTLKAGAQGFKTWVPDPTSGSRIFDGWFTAPEGGEQMLPETKIYRNFTVYAHWHDLAIGDTGPAGGLIFYINNDPALDWRYLEAAPRPEKEQWVKWGQGLDMNTESEVPTSSGIGDGVANSAALIEVDGPDILMNAQKLSIGGYTDWFYPSHQELKLMYENLRAKGLGDFCGQSYWSSSLSLNNRKLAIAVSFEDGHTQFWPMAHLHFVRPIRAFGGKPSGDPVAPVPAP